jgi:hypothetical protein
MSGIRLKGQGWGPRVKYFRQESRREIALKLPKQRQRLFTLLSFITPLSFRSLLPSLLI